MKKLVLLAILVVALSMAAVMPAAAGWTWCSTDPIVTLPHHGGTVNIWVEAPEGARVGLDLWVPAGSHVQPQPSQFTLSVKTHEWKDGNTIKAKVSTKDKAPVRLSATYNGRPLGGQEFDDGKGTIQWSW